MGETWDGPGVWAMEYPGVTGDVRRYVDVCCTEHREACFARVSEGAVLVTWTSGTYRGAVMLAALGLGLPVRRILSPAELAAEAPRADAAGAPVPLSTRTALARVAEERNRQRARWGDDPHPDVGQAWWGDSAVLAPTEVLRGLVEAGKASEGGVGWLEILLEEAGEARDAAGDVVGSVARIDRRRWRARLRGELVQVAAVAVAWLEDLERRAAEEDVDG